MNTWSVEGGTGWYSVLLGQNRAVLVASTMSLQKIYGLHGLNHQIIEYSKKEKVITDKHTDRQTHRQTHRISSCRLDPFCRRGRVKNWQRYNIPKGRVLSPNNRKCFWVISQVLDQNSASEYDRTSASLSEPKLSFKIATLIQPHNLDQASASKSRTKFSCH